MRENRWYEAILKLASHVIPSRFVWLFWLMTHFKPSWLLSEIEICIQNVAIGYDSIEDWILEQQEVQNGSTQHDSDEDSLDSDEDDEEEVWWWLKIYKHKSIELDVYKNIPQTYVAFHCLQHEIMLVRNLYSCMTYLSECSSGRFSLKRVQNSSLMTWKKNQQNLLEIGVG